MGHHLGYRAFAQIGSFIEYMELLDFFLKVQVVYRYEQAVPMSAVYLTRNFADMFAVPDTDITEWEIVAKYDMIVDNLFGQYDEDTFFIPPQHRALPVALLNLSTRVKSALYCACQRPLATIGMLDGLSREQINDMHNLGPKSFDELCEELKSAIDGRFQENPRTLFLQDDVCPIETDFIPAVNYYLEVKNIFDREERQALPSYKRLTMRAEGNMAVPAYEVPMNQLLVMNGDLREYGYSPPSRFQPAPPASAGVHVFHMNIAGRKFKFFEKQLLDGYLTLDYPRTGDLTGMHSGKIMDCAQTAYRSERNFEWLTIGYALDTFVTEVYSEDYVIATVFSKNLLYIIKVTGDYQFGADGSNSAMGHRRKAEVMKLLYRDRTERLILCMENDGSLLKKVEVTEREIQQLLSLEGIQLIDFSDPSAHVYQLNLETEEYARLLKDGYVAPGYFDIGSLQGMDYKAVRKRVKDYCTEQNMNKALVKNLSDSMALFVTEIKTGDYICAIDNRDSKLLILRDAGDYEYSTREAGQPGILHRRRIELVKILDIPRLGPGFADVLRGNNLFSRVFIDEDRLLRFIH